VPVLGIEGTAHTLGVGIVEEDGGRCRILANERAMVRPAPPAPGEPAAGIHPREAAHHHAEAGPGLVHAALRRAGLEAGDLDGIAFSQGPGLGPCLRVAATMARVLALRHGKPLVGVNHCVAHLEVARGLAGAADPLLLYASGANTQVIAYVAGRYRVFGETLDIGVGNALDKFAREQGFPFPGGPEVERLAALADPDRLHELPYSVKGMDMSFAGLATAASRLVAQGVPVPEACHGLQEHAFAALVETAERALAHTGKGELALGGGVCCNARLQAMARSMAQERGVSFHVPERGVLVDNGAMIAWLGLLRLAAGEATPVAQSQVRPYERTDAVEAGWRRAGGGRPAPPLPEGAVAAGAEAVVRPARFLDGPVLAKRRLPKPYRHPALDGRLRAARTRDEARLLVACRQAGVRVPVLLDADLAASTLLLEPVPAPTLGQALAAQPGRAEGWLKALGGLAARMHDAGITHGDLTPANVLAADEGLVAIDFGLGQATEEAEPRAVDLHLVEEALAAAGHPPSWMAWFLDGYRPRAREAVLRQLAEVRERGRYR
jgi:bifunctional N6-L-threonylcarbamoyladenine synthase / protein kinase Bud32